MHTHTHTHTHTHMHAYNLPLSPSHAHTVNTCILLVLAGSTIPAGRGYTRAHCIRELARVAVGAGGDGSGTHSSRELAGVAAGAGSGARLRCQTRELPSVAAGALSRACDICTHVITHNSLQVSTSLYIKMTLLRALVIKIIGMYVCMYVGTFIYITPQVSPPIIFAMEKRWEKIKNIFPTSQERHTKCVRACGRYIRS